MILWFYLLRLACTIWGNAFCFVVLVQNVLRLASSHDVPLAPTANLRSSFFFTSVIIQFKQKAKVSVHVRFWAVVAGCLKTSNMTSQSILPVRSRRKVQKPPPTPPKSRRCAASRLKNQGTWFYHRLLPLLITFESVRFSNPSRKKGLVPMCWYCEVATVKRCASYCRSKTLPQHILLIRSWVLCSWLSPVTVCVIP